MKIFTNTVITLFISGLVLFVSTDGLNAFTSEGVRRFDIENHPITLPKIELTSSTGEEFYIQDFNGKTVLVDFIFTNCNGICPMMTKNFQTLQKELQKTSLKEKIVLLTVSFDPLRDTQDRLNQYADAVRSHQSSWIFANVSHPNDLQKLLDIFGIVVIPAEDGQFEHNGAIHLVNQSSQLAKIYDYESTEIILYDLREGNYGI